MSLIRPINLDEVLIWAEKLPELNTIRSIIGAGIGPDALRIQEELLNPSTPALPWAKTRSVYRARPGESTLWIGANGHGKSTALMQSCVHWALAGQHVVSCSLEMSAAMQLFAISRYSKAKDDRLTRADIESVQERLAEHYTVVDIEGRLDARRVIALAAFSAKELRASHITIDNLTSVIALGDGQEGATQDFVASMHAVARRFGVHVHLVAHIRKPPDPKHIPGRYDARGTGAAPDIVDNVLCVWRNEPKEDANGGSLEAEPDSILRVDKQRLTGRRGLFKLWYFQRGGQLLDSPTSACEALI